MQLPIKSYSSKATYLLLITLFVFLFSCKKDDKPRPTATDERADIVHEWYKLIARLQLNTSPPANALLNNSNFGYIGVGLYEAVRPGIKGAVSLSSVLYQMPQMPAPEMGNYMWRASANAALASLTRQFTIGFTDASKASIDSLENAYNQRLQAENSDAFTRSQVFGRSVATAIIEWSKSDKFTIANPGYVPPVFPGAWEPTPPAFSNAVGPYLKDARPFLESNSTVATPPLPFSYSDDPSLQFHKMVEEVYNISKALTQEQKNIATSWADVAGAGRSYPIPGHIMLLLTQVLEQRKTNLADAAHIYAKVGIAQRDAIIACWKMKFHYNLMRPVTYINRFIDATWQTLVPTPPYPEWPAALPYVYGGILQVMTRELGDNVPVTDSIYLWNGSTPRSYASFSKVAEEVAMSRVYAGIHYKISVDLGLELGKKLGDKVADIRLRP